jgi:hypothetical protein
MTAQCAAGKEPDMDTASIATYNGWSNRETWLASLWLNSAEDSYYVLRDALRESDDLFDQASCLEQALRDQLEDETGCANLWSDLLSTAFERVNWVEVIENNKD